MRGAVAALLCCACASTATVPAPTNPSSIALVSAVDTLTTIERVRIVEGALWFRQMIMLNDSARLDGCSLVPVLGPNYAQLLRRDFRAIVEEPTAPCTEEHRARGFGRRLTLKSITGRAGHAVVTISYAAGGYFHEEDYQVQKASRLPDGHWVGTEMRVYGAMIAD